MQVKSKPLSSLTGKRWRAIDDPVADKADGEALEISVAGSGVFFVSADGEAVVDAAACALKANETAKDSSIACTFMITFTFSRLHLGWLQYRQNPEIVQSEI
jgi:hypothetical protein